jgi:hypothetical protein
MRRAITVLALLVAVVALDAPRAHAQLTTVMNGIGLVDYRHKPDFKIGDWVRYRMQSHSELGARDNYELTLMVAGEEDFWGDPGFWIETWVTMPGVPEQTSAALVSYEIFGDSVATQRLLLYTRKMISMLNEDGTPKMDVNKPAASTLRARREVMNPINFDMDTLGTDTVQTPKGVFKAMKVLMKQGKSATQAVGDSSVYTEVRENRTSFYSTEIPVSHLVREDIESINARKSWLIGRSGDAMPLAIRDRGIGTARLVDFGHNGTPRVVPERLRHTIAEQVAAERAAAKPKTTTKSGTSTKAASTKPSASKTSTAGTKTP